MTAFQEIDFLKGQLQTKTDQEKSLMEQISNLTGLIRDLRSTPLTKSGNKQQTNGNSDLKFTKKEITEMPFLTDCKIRKRKNNVYEIRYRKNGYNMSFSSKDLRIAKDKCLMWLNTLSDLTEANKHFVIVPKNDYKAHSLFGDFAKNYMENVKKRTVKENTYITYMFAFNKHIIPVYGAKYIDEIKPVFIQNHLNKLSEKVQELAKT